MGGHHIAQASEQSQRVRLHGYYVLAVLWLVQLLNMVDRQLPFILAESIKRDLELSDLQIGMLTGVGFSLVYSLVGLPLAWLSDRTSRSWVLAGAVSLWSAMTMIGGFAQNYLQLLCSRMGVAIGEAGCQPQSHAIIAETFPQERRGTMMGIYTLAVPAGAMASLALGGWLNQHFGWRHTMIIVGAPGLLLGFIVLLTIKDRRRAPQRKLVTKFWDVAIGMARTPAFRHSAAGMTLFVVGLSAAHAFAPPFMIRTQGISVGQAGLWLGLLYGIGGIIGTVLGGALSDRLAQSHPGRVLWPTAFGILLSLPFYVFAWLATTAVWSVVLLVPWSIASYMFLAPNFAAAQSAAPSEVRAVVSAVLYACMGIFGVAVGPVVTGLLSDMFAASSGADSLRYALCILVVPQIWAVLHFLLASKAFANGQTRIPLVIERPIDTQVRMQSAEETPG